MFIALLAPAGATAQPPTPTRNDETTSVGLSIGAADFRDLPASTVVALLETMQAESVADRFNGGGLGAGGTSHLVSFLGARRQTAGGRPPDDQPAQGVVVQHAPVHRGQGRVEAEPEVAVGATVEVTLPDGSLLEGVARAVDWDGRLVVATAEGTVELASGDVRHLRART